MSTLIQRHLEPVLTDALREARVVGLLGARYAGKSTLARELAKGAFPAELFTLDRPETLRAALDDPTGFIAGISGPAVIDEIQRAPELLLAIKERVDLDWSPGQFLVTGSANILTLPAVRDALPGRVDYLRLGTLSQGELLGQRETFIADLFEGRFPRPHAPLGKQAYLPAVLSGGYPTVSGRSAAGRSRFFSSYIDSIVGRDLDDIGRVTDRSSMERALYATAAQSGGLANWASLGRDLGQSPMTVKSHLYMLEQLFLIQRLPAWHVNLGARQIKAAKLHIADTGLLAHLLRADEKRLSDEPEVAGMFFETFAVNELWRQTQWETAPTRLYHYRDADGREVDLVMERNDGTVAAVEVKATATPSQRQARGLQHLRDRLGKRFRGGVLLCATDQTIPLGDRIAAAPLAGLWSSGK